MSTIRPYEAGDLESVTRVWRELGWIDDSDRQATGLESLLAGGRGLVGEIDGLAECLAHLAPGRLRYLADDLTLSIVTAVTTSRVARRRGLASTMTSQLLTEAARDGAEVAALGMFEQGFYDRLGFGTGSYENRFRFDPSSLRVPVPTDPTVRITEADADEVYSLMQRAERQHGGIVIDDADVLRAEFHLQDKLVALGLRADDGRLTAALAGNAPKGSEADLEMFVTETPDDALALLGLIRGLSDQWHTVTLTEPPGFQLQDLIDMPFRQGAMRHEAGSGAFHKASGWWQFRILDLEACLRRVRWLGEPMQVVLHLDDPLVPDSETNLSGTWVLSFGDESSARRGSSAGLPVVSAGIGSFSRLWLGVRSATTLARSTDLDAPVDVLETLDRRLALPRPEPGVYF